jgi:hypothetical protein
MIFLAFRLFIFRTTRELFPHNKRIVSTQRENCHFDQRTVISTEAAHAFVSSAVEKSASLPELHFAIPAPLLLLLPLLSLLPSRLAPRKAAPASFCASAPGLCLNPHTCLPSYT